MTDFEAEQFSELKQENTRLRELAQTLVDALGELAFVETAPQIALLDDALSQAKEQGIVPRQD